MLNHGSGSIVLHVGAQRSMQQDIDGFELIFQRFIADKSFVAKNIFCDAVSSFQQHFPFIDIRRRHPEI